MQTDNVSTETKNSDIREIRLEPGIHDLTIPIRDYIENEVPLSDEELNVLRTFDKEYSFEDDIRARGKEAVLDGLDEASKYFNHEEALDAVDKGIKMAQMINPDVPIKPFPIVFLYVPFFGDAKSLHGQGCGINIMALKNKRFEGDSPKQKIVSFTAHETTHTFLKQLGKQPEYGHRTWKQVALDFLWEEGLTTTVEPTHYPPHYVVEADGQFWVDVINRWFKVKSEEEKDSIFKEVTTRPSFLNWYRYMYHRQSLSNNLGPSNDNFLTLLRDRNGVGYHVGSYLWKKELAKAKQEGKTLKDLVMAGSSQMERWITE